MTGRWSSNRFPVRRNNSKIGDRYSKSAIFAFQSQREVVKNNNQVEKMNPLDAEQMSTLTEKCLATILRQTNAPSLLGNALKLYMTDDIERVLLLALEERAEASKKTLIEMIFATNRVVRGLKSNTIKCLLLMNLPKEKKLRNVLSMQTVEILRLLDPEAHAVLQGFGDYERTMRPELRTNSNLIYIVETLGYASACRADRTDWLRIESLVVPFGHFIDIFFTLEHVWPNPDRTKECATVRPASMSDMPYEFVPFALNQNAEEIVNKFLDK
jgi:hypothetical protein